MEFWSQESDYFKLHPLTKEMVANAEKELKVKLPESLLALLKWQNGGYINFDAYPTTIPTEWADDHIKVDHIYCIAPTTKFLLNQRMGTTRETYHHIRRGSLVDCFRLAQL
ncbi:SMI1/KNR4 family protein [Paenibacillus roseipurpureus]|uniref:SMI1/KNR4 family protein n=1 Tax=Paenibacillus roseopurpureus TaxID=2918901 RepID=A0AA96RJ54_9BACL|nr:SMI1/KNR4 family protein [Paenibacillus sp. MBLB1832]WNR42934.1 SMI1/KNR4 family protein [Paenibacillus sp. MBLB1832]